MTEQQQDTQGHQQQTTNSRSKTAPLATSELVTTVQRTEESTTRTRQPTSVTDGTQNHMKARAKITESPFYNIGNTMTGATGISSTTTIHQQTTQGLSTPHSQGSSNELLAGGIAGGLTVLILIGLLLLAVIKRRKTRGLVLAQSNTETAFDNLGFTGGRKISEFMDLTELELVRVRVTNTIKRKISAITKEDQKTRRVSCGRLELVEVPANTDIDSDILLTTWV